MSVPNVDWIDCRPAGADDAPHLIVGASIVLAWMPDEDRPRVEHLCSVLPGDGRPKLVAPLLQEAHEVTGWPEAPTVRPSILCPDCGLHGYVTDGVWSPVIPTGEGVQR